MKCKSKEPVIVGIYCFQNKIDGKCYIGKSINIWDRYKQHINQLNGRYLENKHFINAWHKYGEENFEFSILEECDIKDLNAREKYWIAYYDSRRNGYNGTDGGTGGNTLINYTEEELNAYKEKRSRLNKTYVKRCEDYCLSVLSNKDVLDIVKRFQNGDYNTNIAKDYNVSVNVINNIRSHRTWCSLTDGMDWEKTNGRQIGKKRSVAIDMYTEDGLFVKTFENARIAEAETGVGYRLISAVCHGKKRIAKGYIWRLSGHPFEEFSTEKKKGNKTLVDQYDREWSFIKTYDSIVEAEKAIGVGGIHSSIINGCCAGGYHWLYHKEESEIKEII